MRYYIYVYLYIYIGRGLHTKQIHLYACMENSYVETTLQNENPDQAKAARTIFNWLWGQIHNKGTNTTGRYEKILSPVPDTSMHMKLCNMSSKLTQRTKTHLTKEILHKPAPTPMQTLWGDYVRFEDTSMHRKLNNVYNNSSKSILRITPDGDEPRRAEMHHVRWTSSVCVHPLPAITRRTRNERRACKDKFTVKFESIVYVREIPARINNDGVDSIR